MDENQTTLHKLKRENTIFSQENAVPDYAGPELMNQVAQNELLETETRNINVEAQAAFERFWENSAQDGYENLLATAHRYDLEKEHGGEQDEMAKKEKVLKELSTMAKYSTTRTEKSRKHHVEKARNAYKSAAKSFRKIGDKRRGNGIGYISNAEESIEMMIEGEIELIKAEGLKDNSEKYRINRLQLKKNAMLVNLYNKALENQNLSAKDRRTLERKKENLENERTRNNTQFLPILVDQAIDWKTADSFTDNLVMNDEQFDKFVRKLNNGNMPPDMKELKLLLKTYHANQEKVRQNGEHSNVFSANAMKIVTDKCLALKTVYKKNASVKKALDVLYTQCQRQTEYLKNRAYNEGNQIKDNSMDRQEEDYVPDDEFAQYGVMSNKEYLQLAMKNEFNNVHKDDEEEYDSNDSKTSIYGHRPRMDQEDILNSYMMTVNSYGYIATPNASTINTYIRNKTDGKNAYRAHRVNVKFQLEGADEYKSLTEEELKQIPGLQDEDIADINENVEEWEHETDKTIHRMDKATKENKLPQDTRFYRMVDMGFLQYALHMGENLSTEEKIKGINQKAGTVVQDKAFMSTGFKVDSHFFSGDKGQPVMLTLLADKGTKCFVTTNSCEGEVIFGRGTKYMILGAYAHGKDGKKVPITDSGKLGVTFEDLVGEEDDTVETVSERLQDHESIKNKTAIFTGIEIVAKIIKE